MERVGLSTIFHDICDNVYFQPPSGYQLKYPCIIYEMRTGDTIYADNLPYRFEKCYTVTVIDADPDTTLYERVAMLPMCKMDRCFTADNLNHYVFIMYY